MGTNFIVRVVETISAAGRGASDFDFPSHCNIVGSVIKSDVLERKKERKKERKITKKKKQGCIHSP